jgi:hypothetical protein
VCKNSPFAEGKIRIYNQILSVSLPFTSYPVGLHIHCLSSNAIFVSIRMNLFPLSLVACFVGYTSVTYFSKSVRGRRATSDPKSRGPVVINHYPANVENRVSS